MIHKPKTSTAIFLTIIGILFYILIYPKILKVYTPFNYLDVLSIYNPSFHKVYVFIMKVPYFFLTLFLLLLVTIYVLLYLMYKDELQRYPNLKRPYYVYRKLIWTVIMVVFILLFLYQNITFNLLAFDIEYFIFFLLIALIFIFVTNMLYKKMNSVMISIHTSKLNEHEERDEVKYIFLRSQIILLPILMFLIVFTGYRYNKIMNTYSELYPKQLVLSGEDTHFDLQDQPLCRTEETFVMCMYDNQFDKIFKSYKLTEVKVTINNEELLNNINSNKYNLRVTHYKLVSVEDNIFTFSATEISYYYFMYETLLVLDGEDSVKLTEGDFDIELTLTRNH